VVRRRYSRRKRLNEEGRKKESLCGSQEGRKSGKGKNTIRQAGKKARPQAFIEFFVWPLFSPGFLSFPAFLVSLEVFCLFTPGVFANGRP
jgi:hypothetical protein